jgi:hypothetical protein
MKTNASNSPLPAGDVVDLRPPKPPVELPDPYFWWYVAGGTVLVLAAAALAWWWWRRRAAVVTVVPVVPPHVRAKQRLAEALRLISDANAFCTEVSLAARCYLEERFSLRAPERTTEEFLVELRASQHLTRDQKESLGQFLESCDLVKFARFEPNEAVLRQLHDSALRLVDETQFDEIAAAAAAANPPDAPLSPTLVNRKS